jgi:ParB-like chromosome segregation protein Spo0J
MMIHNNDIKISQEYAQLVPELTKEEFEELKQSIKEADDLYVPIIVNQHGVILDGHHRYKACEELKIEPRTMVREFEDPLLEKKFVIEVNHNRRNLKDFQKAELGVKLKQILTEIAKQNSLANLKHSKVSSSSN